MTMVNLDGCASSLAPVALKIRRLAAGNAPRVLDLFSGCGGLSLGFQRAGFEIVGGLEKDPVAASVYSENIHRSEDRRCRENLGKSRDINSFSPLELLEDLGHSDAERKIDILVGGPPCQAYARVGRAKLREIKGHPEAFQLDDRGSLYLNYLEYVRALCPLAIVLENVPDILNYGGRNVVQEIAGHLVSLGYLVNFGLLNAACYGVPQTRRRLYLVAFHRHLALMPSMPPPTHKLNKVPVGYREFENLASSLRDGETPFCGPDPARSIQNPHELTRAVTVRDAIGDLPQLTCHLSREKIRVERKRFMQVLPYDSPPLSSFAHEMRMGWPKFSAGEGVRDHVIRWLPRDYQIFSEMKPGDDYPKAHKIALKLFEDELGIRRKLGLEMVQDGADWCSLKKSIVPPYDPTKFPNKWCKMRPDEPARTLLAHLSHDSYTHIHYDDRQARTISVREAARLQSFPDGFHFCNAMNPAFRMIGNAVPPLMAFAIARHIYREILGIVLQASGSMVRGELEDASTLVGEIST